jgi:hypothetical protein
MRSPRPNELQTLRDDAKRLHIERAHRKPGPLDHRDTVIAESAAATRLAKQVCRDLDREAIGFRLHTAAHVIAVTKRNAAKRKKRAFT